jgi:hypothetical protein
MILRRKGVIQWLKQRYIDLIREHFNAGVAYKGRVLKWDTVIEQKTKESAQFLIGKLRSIEFVEPASKLERNDNPELRGKILCLTTSQARKCGVGKSTLHYLRMRAERNRSFVISPYFTPAQLIMNICANYHRIVLFDELQSKYSIHIKSIRDSGKNAS